MSCTFCVTEDNFDALEFETALRLLDQLVEQGFRSVIFGGGEPLTWRGDVFVLAAEAQHRGLHVQIGTNGINLPDDFTHRDCVDRYVLPLESVDAAVHDAMRIHHRSHHATILERMTALREAGKSLTVSTVLTATNCHGVLDLAAFLADYHGQAQNVHAWHLYQFLPLGRGGRPNTQQLAVPAEEYRRLCRQVKAQNLPFRIFQRTDMYRPNTIEFFWGKSGQVVCGSESLHGEVGNERNQPTETDSVGTP